VDDNENPAYRFVEVSREKDKLIIAPGTSIKEIVIAIGR
jgi:hypothetical protein